MNRTDLCQEAVEAVGSLPEGIEKKVTTAGETEIVTIRITTKEGSAMISKPCGTYVTVTLPHFAHQPESSKEAVGAITKTIAGLLPQNGLALVVGVGNQQITPDAYGPDTAQQILATRHVDASIGFRPVSVLSPGVLSQTGMELGDLVRWVVDQMKPSCVIAIDALAAASPKRLGCTLQISDQGIAPGSGVANNRQELSPKTLGIPVIGIGVPTVMDARPLLPKNQKLEDWPAQNLMITPRDVDLMVKRAADLTATAVNCALQKDLSADEIHYLLR